MEILKNDHFQTINWINASYIWVGKKPITPLDLGAAYRPFEIGILLDYGHNYFAQSAFDAQWAYADWVQTFVEKPNFETYDHLNKIIDEMNQTNNKDSICYERQYYKNFRPWSPARGWRLMSLNQVKAAVMERYLREIKNN